MFSVPKSTRFGQIVLASSSPRRCDILKNKGGITNLLSCSSTYEDENKGKFNTSDVYSYTTGLALGKVKQVAQLYKLKTEETLFERTLFIGADTVVLLDGKISEKPVDRCDAVSMLKRLCGRTHQVHTGVVLLVPNKDDASPEEFHTHIFHESTDVTLPQHSDEVIERYVDVGESMDKAGGFGIQALGAQLVEGIKGDYYNVVGFPLFKFCQELNKFIEQLEAVDS